MAINKFLKLGILAISPLIIVSPAYLWNINQIQKDIRIKPDNSIILVSNPNEKFLGSCQTYSSGAIGEGYQKTFNNINQLLHLLTPDPDKFPAERIKMSFPPSIKPFSLQDGKPFVDEKGNQLPNFFEYSKPLKELNSVFTKLGTIGISDGSIRAEGTKKVIYTKNRFDSGTKSFSKIDSLYKCHNGIGYGFELLSLDSFDYLDELDVDEQRLIQHLGIL